MNNSFKVSLLFIVVFLVGCAGRVKVLPTLNEESVAAPQQGLVVARIINASSYSLPINYLTVAPENFNESEDEKLLQLQALEPAMASTTVFAALVDEGNYSLSSVSSYFFNGNYAISRFARADARFGTFKVEAGKVTDLGGLVFYPKTQEDKYMDTLLRIPEGSLGQVIDRHFPFYEYNSDELISWNLDEFDEERLNVFVSTAQNPVSFGFDYKAPDESLYFLSKLGVIVKRDQSGEWELDAVDTNLELTAVAQNAGGDLIVGGYEGRVFYKKFGSEWQDISIDTDYMIESLSFIYENKVQAVVKKNYSLDIMHADIELPNLQWSILNSYNGKQGWKNLVKSKNAYSGLKTPTDQLIVDSYLFELDGQHYVSLTTKRKNLNPVFTKSDTKTYRYDPGTWVVYELDKELEVIAVIDAGASKLGIKAPSFWSLSQKYEFLRFSDIKGQWEDISTYLYMCGKDAVKKGTLCPEYSNLRAVKRFFDLVSVPVFRNENEVSAIVNLKMYTKDPNEPDYLRMLVHSEDGGQTWLSSGGELPKQYCTSLVNLVYDPLILSCNGATGDFYESYDNGANWSHVRQQENF